MTNKRLPVQILPMLAKNFTDRNLPSSYFRQPKLDGVRMVWTGRNANSRTGKEIKGMPLLLEEIADLADGFPLDGELYCHTKSFQKQLGSIRRTVNIHEDLEIGYHVYDHPVASVEFAERWERVLERVKPGGRIHLVETVEGTGVESADELNIFEARGYEGTMLRSASGLYKFGKRSKDLLKLKTMQDAEFEVVGLVELCHYEKLIVPEGTPGSKPYADGTWYKNGEATTQATAGAVVCKLADGRTFEVGTGMDDQMRQALWNEPPIGKMLTVKFQEYTDEGIPRFPVFVAIRDYE